MRTSTLALTLSLLAAAPSSTLAAVKTIEIAPGVDMPMVGIGTWQYNDTVAGAAVTSALDLGYDLIDTAFDYTNQVGIGKALKASSRARSSYFVTTKIPGGLDAAGVTKDMNANLEMLQLDFVDLMLVHYPVSMDGNNTGGKESRQATWKAMEAFVKAGKARAIGVSHFCKHHMEDVLEISTITPAVNQVQYHVGMGSAGPLANDYRDWMKTKGVLMQPFSSLCGPCGTTELINGPLVTGIGKRYGKTGAQVSLKWVVQSGYPVIPKASNPKYLTENLDLFGWELSAADMATLTAATSPAVAGPNATSGDCPLV